MGGSISLEAQPVENSKVVSTPSLFPPPPRITKNPSFSKIVSCSSSRRSSNSVCAIDEPGNLNALEVEAIGAVHELRSVVKDVYVSDKLPRTPDLIYLNLTTAEGDAYCVELTCLKGWRVSSLRHDCMNGDIAHLDLHVQYFDTMQALMRHVSTSYEKNVKNSPMFTTAPATIIEGHTSTESDYDGMENQTFT